MRKERPKRRRSNSTPKTSSGEAALLAKIERIAARGPFTSFDVVPNDRERVSRLLRRLAASGALIRVARGVYARVTTNPYVDGPVPPELNAIVRAALRPFGATIQMQGAEAAARLGLTTQLPLRTVFETSGRSRTLVLGRRPVSLRRVSRRRLALAGRPAGIALAALFYVGAREVNQDTFVAIERRLSPREFRALAEHAPHMPKWMARALKAYLATGKTRKRGET